MNLKEGMKDDPFMLLGHICVDFLCSAKNEVYFTNANKLDNKFGADTLSLKKYRMQEEEAWLLNGWTKHIV
jgi:hypothetical protein